MFNKATWQKLSVSTFAIFITSTFCIAQFSPQAPLLGHEAIHRNDPSIKHWIKDAVFEPGWVQLTDTLLGKVSSGNVANVVGKANNMVLSLGDGGIITCSFEYPIINGPGPDFVVFENGFLNILDSTEAFLELAFVEVSSNGTDFVRMPATCLTQNSTQLANDSFSVASNIDNLAGKHINNWGTPFDLDDVQNEATLDLNIGITHIRLIDVIGILDETLGSKDKNGNIINDPYPTPFPSSAFDLDGIGVLNTASLSSHGQHLAKKTINLFPNPAADKIFWNDILPNNTRIKVLDALGKEWISEHGQNGFLDISILPAGSYFLMYYNEQFYGQNVFIKL